MKTRSGPSAARSQGARRPAGRPPLMPKEAWIIAARRMLIESGVDRVKIDRLAGLLGVTTGSFYWHFKDRAALLDHLLQDWEFTNSAPHLEAVMSAADDPLKQLRRLNEVWLEEQDYSPAYDAAVRDWARTSPAAEAAVRRVDAKRIELQKSVYVALGDDETTALVRARITYFHQVGYYAMRIQESVAFRRQMLPAYMAMLAGLHPLPRYPKG